MPELSGFTAATKLVDTRGPQSMRVPKDTDQLVKKAKDLVAAMVDAVKDGLTPNIALEVLLENGAVKHRIKVVGDGVADTVGQPGHWLAVDGTRLLAMQPHEYGTKFTENVPLEWDGKVTAEVTGDGTVTLMFDEPTSANRPFAYSVLRDGKTAKSSEQIRDHHVTLTPDAKLKPGETATYTLQVDATRYPGIEGTATVEATLPAPEPEGDQPDQ